MNAVREVLTSSALADAYSDAAYGAVLAELRRGRRFVVTSHTAPDGDAVGSSLAMGAVLEQLGCEVSIVLAGAVPAIYAALPGVPAIRSSIDPAFAPDAVLLLECDSVERSGLPGLHAYRLVNIDHHASGQAFAQLNWIDPGAYAVAAMVYRLARDLGANITPQIATCLYTAVLTDTGSFTYQATNAGTFDLARQLVEFGADPHEIARQVYFNSPVSKLRLLGAALSRMSLRCSGKVAITSITQAELARNGATNEDCEGVANYLIGIEGVEIAIFLRECTDGDGFRVSLRSKGGGNVAAIAEHFGGGGHLNASGCTITLHPGARAGELAIEQTVAMILAEMPPGVC